MKLAGMKPPNQDEIEITVFGPGYGEALAIHVGSGRWLLVDSCLNDAKKPAAIEYLKEIAVDVATQVEIVAASHRHDDHIKDLSTVLKECRSAKLYLSSAFQKQEFVGLIQTFEDQAAYRRLCNRRLGSRHFGPRKACRVESSITLWKTVCRIP